MEENPNKKVEGNSKWKNGGKSTLELCGGGKSTLELCGGGKSSLEQWIQISIIMSIIQCCIRYWL